MDICVRERSLQANEYVDLLRSLTGEIDTALIAMTHHQVSALEESIGRQEQIAWMLTALQSRAKLDGGVEEVGKWPASDELGALEIREVEESLRRSTQIYGDVLRHASHSGRLMLSLLNSSKGDFQEASVTRRGYPTWSGQM